MLKVLDLFSGIGGFSLGLERTGGFKTVAFCELDPYCRGVLKRHWPNTPCFEDVRALTKEQVGEVDVICGGFPCQDISTAGKGAGIEGQRSGLWAEFARLVGQIRPPIVLVENVAALRYRNRGLARVLGDLASLGYDAEWHCIPAAAVGAPHTRDRIWIVAYPSGVRCGQPEYSGAVLRAPGGQGVEALEAGGTVDCGADVSNAMCARRAHTIGGAGQEEAGRPEPVSNDDQPDLPDSSGDGLSAVRHGGVGGEEKEDGSGLAPLDGVRLAANDNLPDPHGLTPLGLAIARQECAPWPAEPAFCRLVDGLPRGLGRERSAAIRAYGNSLVPQIPELIGRAILEVRNGVRYGDELARAA